MGKCTLKRNGKILSALEEIEYLLELNEQQRQMLLDAQAHTKEFLQNEEIVFTESKKRNRRDNNDR